MSSRDPIARAVEPLLEPGESFVAGVRLRRPRPPRGDPPVARAGLLGAMLPGALGARATRTDAAQALAGSGSGGSSFPSSRAMAWALTDHRVVVFALRDVTARPRHVRGEVPLTRIRWGWARPTRWRCYVALLLTDATVHEFEAGRRAGAPDFVESLTGLLEAVQPEPGTWHPPPGSSR